VKFNLSKINRVENKQWFKTKIDKKANGPGEKAEVAMKQALRQGMNLVLFLTCFVGGARTLNVYSVKSTNEIAGWATLPVDYAEEAFYDGKLFFDNFRGCRELQHNARRKLKARESRENIDT
jgi:hypothetical protein